MNTLTTSNTLLTSMLIKKIAELGCIEYCICPGGRNAPLVALINRMNSIEKTFFFEERSAAFFALGRARAKGRPVAVVTTSGTAVGELLPATMEAYYNATPLILITADRPRRFRGSGAPQSAEQVNIFGRYVEHCYDIDDEVEVEMLQWSYQKPLHINVCFEEPLTDEAEEIPAISDQFISHPQQAETTILEDFLSRVRNPLVIVSTLKPHVRTTVAHFLKRYLAPTYFEAVSGLREEPSLVHLRIHNPNDYPFLVNGILRIGGVPTIRYWRDLEMKEGELPVLSVNETPFSGLSWGKILPMDLNQLASISIPKIEGRNLQRHKETLPSTYMYRLSKLIPEGSHIYLGNSLPIREWDQYATYSPRGYQMTASRGLNGIDGQLSTFLGMCDPKRSNWAILGDLTTLYDLAGPWPVKQMGIKDIHIVVINNGGGQIFSKKFQDNAFINSHDLSFEPFAKMWGFHYYLWHEVPDQLYIDSPSLIELKVSN